MQGGNYPYITYERFEIIALKQPIKQKINAFKHKSRKTSFLFSSFVKSYVAGHKNSVYLHVINRHLDEFY